MKYYLGVDPGINGAICLIDENSQIIDAQIMPQPFDYQSFSMFTYQFLLKHRLDNREVEVYLEEILAYGMNASSAFSFGKTCAITEVVLDAYFPRALNKVYAKDWTKAIHAGIDKRFKPKEKSAIAAKKIFPNYNFKKSVKCKKDHDGLIDAALIAEYGRLVNL